MRRGASFVATQTKTEGARLFAAAHWLGVRSWFELGDLTYAELLCVASVSKGEHENGKVWRAIRFERAGLCQCALEWNAPKMWRHRKSKIASFELSGDESHRELRTEDVFDAELHVRSKGCAGNA
jgi:hypothetical protein